MTPWLTSVEPSIILNWMFYLVSNHNAHSASIIFFHIFGSFFPDFPAVNWVVQLDCPEDANTYIHRAGRTARYLILRPSPPLQMEKKHSLYFPDFLFRYQKDGQSLLVLLPSEEPEMLKVSNIFHISQSASKL